MSLYSINIKPFGDKTILIEWPNEVSSLILNDILGFEKKVRKTEVKGTEFIVAYNSLSIIYNTNINFSEVKERVLGLYNTIETETSPAPKSWKIPVCYDTTFGIDLDKVCKSLKLSKDKLVSLHTASIYTVYGIGFLPGFMYLGGLPLELEVARRETPRLNVARGSVGLAAKQTGIYPQESPGGWNIIGNCPIPIFDATQEEPCFVSVGDKVRFYEISKSEYDLLKIETEVGIFKTKSLVDD